MLIERHTKVSNMEKIKIEHIEGAYVVKFKRFSDDRGYFQEVFSHSNYVRYSRSPD